MTPRQAADLRLRLAAERLQRANDELEAAEREHVAAALNADAQDRLPEPATVPKPACICGRGKFYHPWRFCETYTPSPTSSEGQS
jgi:hypothetical protein